MNYFYVSLMSARMLHSSDIKELTEALAPTDEPEPPRNAPSTTGQGTLATFNTSKAS